MKSFLNFLENYDVYLDKPLGYKKTKPQETEETDSESTAQEEITNEVKQ